VNFYMEKRGKTGQIITTIPVMILIFIIMGIFVLLSASIFQLKKAENKVPDKIVAESFKDSFLLEEIEIEGEKILLFDFIADIEGVEERDFARGILKGYFEKTAEDGECMFLMLQSGSFRNELAEFKKENGEVSDFGLLKNDDSRFIFHDLYELGGYMKEIRADFGKSDRKISYYYGECLEVVYE